jgi:hypothetical protein
MKRILITILILIAACGLHAQTMTVQQFKDKVQIVILDSVGHPRSIRMDSVGYLFQNLADIIQNNHNSDSVNYLLAADSNILKGYLSYYQWLQAYSLIMGNFSNYVTISSLTATLTPYATKATTWTRAQLDSLLTARGYLTGVDWSIITNKPAFAIVATSGSYNDLLNKPSIWTQPQIDSILTAKAYETQAHAAATYYPLSNPSNYVDNIPNIDSSQAIRAVVNTKVAKAQADTTYLNRSDSTKYYTSLNKFNQRPDLFRFNYIGGADNDTPLIRAAPSGWDQRIREMGNVFYDSLHNQWVLCYTGFTPPYGGQVSHAGIATSVDGIIWAKGGLASDGKITDSLTEDPYIVYRNANQTYYLYTENKRTGINITLQTSTDLIHWNYQGIVFDTSSLTGGWESQDVSSPTMFTRNDTLFLFYEGRQLGGQQGAIGLAISTDWVNFTRYSGNPIIGGSNTVGTYSWATNTVGDAIVFNNGRYFMTTETLNGSSFVTGLCMSTDMYHWKDYFGEWLLNQNPISDDGEGVMPYIFNNDLNAIYTDTAGSAIYRTHFYVRTTTQDDIKHLKQGGDIRTTNDTIGQKGNLDDVFVTNYLDRLHIFSSGQVAINSNVAGIGKLFVNGSQTNLVGSAGAYAFQWGYNNFYYSLVTGAGAMLLGGAANNTYNPSNMLDVYGAVSVGADYTGANGKPAPTNGMNIEGRVCINTRADDGVNYIQTKSPIRTGVITVDSGASPTGNDINWGYNGVIYGNLTGQGYGQFGKNVVQQGQVDIYPVLTSRRGLTITQKDSTTANQPDLFECLSPSGTQRLAAFTHYGGLFVIDTAFLNGYTYLKSTPAYVSGGDSMLVKNATTLRVETVPVIAYVDSVKRIGDTVWYYKSGSKLYGFTDSLASSGGGTVTSVGLTVPSWLSAGGSPVTGAGTLAVTATTGQTANQVLATPDATTGSVGLRALVANDIPSLAWSKITTGIPTTIAGYGITDGVSTGGSYTNPAWIVSIPYSKLTSIPDAAADGTTKGVSTYTASDFNTTTGVVSLDYTNGQKATASVPGFLSSTDWSTFNSKISANQTITLSSDVAGSGTTSIAATVNGLKGVALPTLASGLLRYNGTTWAFDASSFLTANQSISFAPTGDVTGSTTGTTSLTPVFAIGAGKVTNTMLAGSIDLTSKVTNALPIANGGSGQITANAALNAFLPSQATNSGKFLTTDGTNTSWGSPSGSGTVTSFSAGNLSPLFTSSVATSTSTPALTFSLSNAAAHTFYGNFTAGSAAPSFGSPTLASADYANQGTATTVLHGNAAGNPSWAQIAIADLSATGTPSSTTYLRGDNTWATVTGGSAAGSSTNVTYNNAGTSAGSSQVGIDLTDKNLEFTSVTGTTQVPAPSAGLAKVYTVNRTGIDRAAVTPSVGSEYYLQANLARQNSAYYDAFGGNGWGYEAFGNLNVAPSSSNGFISTSTTSELANFNTKRAVTGTTSGTAAGMYSSASVMTISTTAHGHGGLITEVSGFSVYNANERIFEGIIGAASLGAFPSGDPSSFVNILGIGKDVADATLQVMYNDASGVATKVNTSITPNQNDVYIVTVFVNSAGTAAYVTLEDISTTTVTIFNSGALSTNLPAAGGYGELMMISNGTTAATRTIDLISCERETQY